MLMGRASMQGVIVQNPKPPSEYITVLGANGDEFFKVTRYNTVIRGPLHIGSVIGWHLTFGNNRISLDHKPNIIFRILARLAGCRVSKVSKIECNRIEDLSHGLISIVPVIGDTILADDSINDPKVSIMFKMAFKFTAHELGMYNSDDSNNLLQLTVVWSDKLAYAINDKGKLESIKLGPQLSAYLNDRAKRYLEMTLNACNSNHVISNCGFISLTQI